MGGCVQTTLYFLNWVQEMHCKNTSPKYEPKGSGGPHGTVDVNIVNNRYCSAIAFLILLILIVAVDFLKDYKI